LRELNYINTVIADASDVVVESNEGDNSATDHFSVVATDLPEIEVSPLAIDFGQVDIGDSAPAVVTVTNLGEGILTVHELGWSGDPAISLDPVATPINIATNETVDLFLTFAPIAETASLAELTLLSNDGDETYVMVPIEGAGVVSSIPPAQQIVEMLAFFDAAVTDGSLEGVGPGRSASGRLGALRNMIESAGEDIRLGDIVGACDTLEDALKRTDGLSPPPDFATGIAATEMAGRIMTLRESLGCS